MEVKRERYPHRSRRFFHRGFNPCFDGSEARDAELRERKNGTPVSILVLMEVKRETITAVEANAFLAVSILVLMEVKRESSRFEG